MIPSYSYPGGISLRGGLPTSSSIAGTDSALLQQISLESANNSELWSGIAACWPCRGKIRIRVGLHLYYRNTATYEKIRIDMSRPPRTTRERRSGQQQHVAASYISDPAAASEGIEFLDQDAIKLGTEHWLVLRVMVRRKDALVVFHSTTS